MKVASEASATREDEPRKIRVEVLLGILALIGIAIPGIISIVQQNIQGGDIAELKEDASNLRADTSTLREEVDPLSEDIRLARSELDALNITSLVEEVTFLQGLVANLTIEVETAKNNLFQIGNLSDTISTTVHKVDGISAYNPAVEYLELHQERDSRCVRQTSDASSAFMGICHDLDSDLWHLDVNGRIRVKDTGNCLQAESDDTVTLLPCTEDLSQIWSFTGTRGLFNLEREKCLAFDSSYTVGNGDPAVSLLECDSSNEQSFFFDKPGRLYTLFLGGPNSCVVNSGPEVKRYSLETCLQLPYARQFLYQSDESILDDRRFRETGETNCWTLNLDDLTIDHTVPCDGSARQKWYYEDFSLKSRFNDKCLSVENSAAGEDIQVLDCENNSDQFLEFKTLVQPEVFNFAFGS